MPAMCSDEKIRIAATAIPMRNSHPVVWRIRRTATNRMGTSSMITAMLVISQKSGVPGVVGAATPGNVLCLGERVDEPDSDCDGSDRAIEQPVAPDIPANTPLIPCGLAPSLAGWLLSQTGSTPGLSCAFLTSLMQFIAHSETSHGTKDGTRDGTTNHITSAYAGPERPDRRVDLDWVRIAAFGLLIFYHVGMLYVSWGFHIKSEHRITALEPLMLVLNPWRLALLFLVSGAATRFMLRKYAIGRCFAPDPAGC